MEININTIMPMIHLTQKKEEYRIPLVEFSDVLPDILCESPVDWGNEGLEPGDEIVF